MTLRFGARGAVGLAVAVLAVLCGAGNTVSAAAVTNCAGGAPICNGNVYYLSYAELGGGTLLIDLTIDTTNYVLPVGRLAGFELRLDGIPAADSESMVLLAAPFFSDWFTTTNGLGASGCTGAPSSALCVDWVGLLPSPHGYQFTPGEQLSFQFLLTSTATPTAGQGKFLFVDSTGDKVGSDALIHIGIDLVPDPCSLNPDYCAPPPPPDEVPEPSTLGLLGAGLASLALLAGKRLRN